MKLGIAISTDDNWHFFHEIAGDLKSHYETNIFRYQSRKYPVFHERINRVLFHQSFGNFLKSNDVVFFEWASSLLVVATKKYPKKCKIVTRLHSYELFEWAPKINWEAVDKIILVSNAMRRRFGELFPSQVQKTEVIYNGVSLDKYQQPRQRTFDFNLGMLSIISPIKRVYEIVIVVARLKKQGLEPCLRIAGIPIDDMRYPAAIKSLVDRLDLSDNVVFDGMVTDTTAWLQNIDILISNSYWEGHPVSLLEGMACGCYCLSHHWNGAEEILPVENLYISDAELIEKIMAYIDSPTEEKEANQARMRAIAVEMFDIEQTKRKIRGVIEEVTNKGIGA